MADFSSGPGSSSAGSSSGANDAFDWIYKFGKSGVESIPELVGISPSVETEQWRQENPWSGVASELIGMGVPYVGWYKAAAKIPRLAKAVETVGKVSERPIVSGALQEGMRYLPFEAGRLAASQVVGDKPFTEMLGETSFNLAAGMGVAGVLHGLASAGRRDPGIAQLFPGLNLDLPPTLKARAMKDYIAKAELEGGLSLEDLGRARGKLAETLREARTEELPEGFKYVGQLAEAEGKSPGDFERQLNRLFKVRGLTEPIRDETAEAIAAAEGTAAKSIPILQIRKFATGVGKDFQEVSSPTGVTWREEAKAAGLPDGFEDMGQFFRQLSFKPRTSGEKDLLKAQQRALQIDTQITNNMKSLGNGLYMTREADDGLYIMAKKYSGQAAEGSANDKWILFKTDKPGQFSPMSEDFLQAQIKAQSWTPHADLAADGGLTYNAMVNYMYRDFPLRLHRVLAETPGAIGPKIASMLPQGVRQNEAILRSGEWIKEHLTPRLFQYRKSHRANWMDKAEQTAYDQAEDITQEMMNGVAHLDPGRALIFAQMSGRAGALGGGELNPIRQAVKSLGKDGLHQFWERVWQPGVKPEALQGMMEQGTITPEVKAFAELMERHDKFIREMVNKAEAATGNPITKWLEGRYLLGRQWEGDTRVIINNDTGQVVAIADGATRREAQANAQAILKRNPTWHIDKEFSLSDYGAGKTAKDIPESIRPVVKAPSWTLERTRTAEGRDIRGFRWDTKPFTEKEFLDAVESSLRTRNNYQANITSNSVLGPQFETLAREDPAAFRIATSRSNARAGVQSKFGKIQNQLADQILAPMLGPNSASKLASITNTLMHNFQLGAGQLMYPITNILTFLQNVVPEQAFVLGGATDNLSQYSHFAAGGTRGPIDSLSVLNPLKMQISSMAEMRKPSEGLQSAFKRAENERVIQPRNVEEYVGESATKAADIRKLFTGATKPSDFNFGEWLRAVSEFLPAQSERFSRAHAFTVGYRTARDFLRTAEGKKLNQDQMYNFAKEFTEKTMYAYTAADRAKIFTTPLGSSLGLFKNWMMHYIASMGEYTAEGFMRNNWAPLLWQTGSTAALGGLSSTPLYWAADAFSRMWSDKSLFQNAYDQFGEGGDAVMLGLPAAMTGISMHSQVNSPFANPVRDAASMFDMVAWDRVKSLSKLAGAAMDNWQATGEHPAHNARVRELMARTFAPKTIYQTMAAMSDPTNIIALGTGYPTLQDVSPAYKMLHGFGFNSVELDRAQAVSQELFKNKEAHRAMITKLGRNWVDARTQGDSQQMAYIMRQAMMWGIDISSVMKSAKAIMDKQSKDIVERQAKPADIAPYLSILRAGQE